MLRASYNRLVTDIECEIESYSFSRGECSKASSEVSSMSIGQFDDIEQEIETVAIGKFSRWPKENCKKNQLAESSYKVTFKLGKYILATVLTAILLVNGANSWKLIGSPEADVRSPTSTRLENLTGNLPTVYIDFTSVKASFFLWVSFREEPSESGINIVPIINKVEHGSNRSPSPEDRHVAEVIGTSDDCAAKQCEKAPEDQSTTEVNVQSLVSSVKVSSTEHFEYPLPPVVLVRGRRQHQEQSESEVVGLNFTAFFCASRKSLNIEGADYPRHMITYRRCVNCRSTCSSKVCYKSISSLLKMAQWNVVGHIRTFQVAVAASKVDPDPQTVYQLPMEDAQNGSENFVWRSPQDGGLGLPSHTRNGAIRKPPQDHTERAFENGWHKKSKGTDWKIVYLFPEKLKATIEPLVEAAKKENRSITVGCVDKPGSDWKYSLLTKETRFRKKTKYTLIRPDFNILSIPDLLSEGGSKYISTALKNSGFTGLSSVMVDYESNKARKGCPNGKITFYSTLIPDPSLDKPKVTKVPVTFEVKDAVTGKKVPHKIVLQVVAKIPKDPNTFKDGNFNGNCRQCGVYGHVAWACTEIDDIGTNFTGAAARINESASIRHNDTMWNVPSQQPNTQSRRSVRLPFVSYADTAASRPSPNLATALDNGLDLITEMQAANDVKLSEEDRRKRIDDIIAKQKAKLATAMAAPLVIGSRLTPEGASALSTSPRPGDMDEAKLKKEIASLGQFEFGPKCPLIEKVDQSDDDTPGAEVPQEYIINNVDHKRWHVFSAKTLGVSINTNRNFDGSAIFSNGSWTDDEDRSYKRKSLALRQGLAKQFVANEWKSFIRVKDINKLDVREMFLSENVETLARIMLNKTKRAEIFKLFHIEYTSIHYKVDMAEIIEEENKGRSQTRKSKQDLKDSLKRDFESEAAAICCIFAALEDGCGISHKDVIEEDYVTVNGRRKLNKIRIDERKKDQ